MFWSNKFTHDNIKAVISKNLTDKPEVEQEGIWRALQYTVWLWHYVVGSLAKTGLLKIFSLKLLLHLHKKIYYGIILS